MKDNLTYIAVVLDRSGSMGRIAASTMSGFNEFINAQKLIPGECLFSLALFNHNYSLLHDGVPLSTVHPLTAETYVPAGNTALFDAIGNTINSVGAKLAAMPESERPSKVLFVIQTDGEENSSKLFNREQIFNMISHQKSVYSWEFIFLGAGQDALGSAASIGININNAIQYLGTNASTDAVFGSATTLSSSYRTTGTLKGFTQEDRLDVLKDDSSTNVSTKVP